MIDLHIHTTHSDGDYTAIEILDKAEQEKLDIISITDHNQISAYDELANVIISDHYTGKIILGSELKCVFNHIPMEVLAYGFDLEKMKNSDCIITPKKLYEVQANYLDYIKEKGNSIGLYFDKSLKINKDKIEYAAAVFERELWKDKRNEEILKRNGIEMKQPFYREAQSNPNSIFYIDESKQYYKISELIEEIHKVGGMAFLAHLYEYPLENHEEILEQIIRQNNIDGIECYHSSFSKNQSDFLIDFCSKNGLFMSGGSDYHGKAKPKVKFARANELEPIPNEIISPWQEKVNYIE